MDKGDGTVKYVLTGDGAGTLFLIDEKSGDIHATKRLDREEKAMYMLIAKVLDRNTNAELEPDTEFNIKIHDINDNAPKFAREIYFASVPEMSEVGKLSICLDCSRFPKFGKNRNVHSKKSEEIILLGQVETQSLSTIYVGETLYLCLSELCPTAQ